MRECSYCKKSHSRTIGGGTRQSKYCSPSCGRKARDKAVAGRYYQRAVQLKPKEALRVERVEQGAGGGKLDGKYLYVFLCKECRKNEVQYECHFFYSSKPKIPERRLCCENLQRCDKRIQGIGEEQGDSQRFKA